MAEHRCPTCGGTPRLSSHVFCSKECYYVSRRVTLTCPCGKDFVRLKGQIKGAKVHYCSRECRDALKFQFTKPTNYKGDQASYSSMHKWVVAHRGRATQCEQCGQDEGRIHWANISGEYKRDLEDWWQLCPPCHAEWDGMTNGTPRRGPGVLKRFAHASHVPDVKTNVECVCKGCGGHYYFPPARAKRSVYCSRACYLDARASGAYVGEQSNKERQRGSV